MCVHWLTGDGLRREDGLRASERPEVLLQRIARSCVCAVVVCAHFCLIDRERSRCVWLSPRAPRPRPRARSVGRRVPESFVYAAAAGCAHIHMRHGATGTAGRTWEGVRGGECCHQSATPTWHMPDDSTTGSSRSLLTPPGRLFRQLHPTGVRSGSPSPGRHRLAQAASRLCTGGRQCHRCHASGVLPPPPPPPPLGVVLHLAFSEIQSRGGRSPGW